MIDRNLKFKQKSFQSAHSRLNFLLWFFQIIATSALQNFVETQPLGVQQSISERVAEDLHKTNFTISISHEKKIMITNFFQSLNHYLFNSYICI